MTDFNMSLVKAMNRQSADSVLYMTIIVTFLGIVGFIGNICVLVIFFYNYPRCNFKYFVITLAIIDITSCLTTIPGEIFSHRHWFEYPDTAIWFCKVKTYFNGFTVFVSAFNLFLVAVDRYRKTCCPLKWQIKPRRAAQLSMLSFLIAFIFSTPAIFLWGKQTAKVTFQGQNVTIQLCEKDDNFKNTVYPSIFVNFIFFLPVITLMISTGVLYGLIIRRVFCGSLSRSFTLPTKPKTDTPLSKFRFRSTRMKELENRKSKAILSDELYDSEENTPNLCRKHQQPVVTREENLRKKQLTSRTRMLTKTLIMFILTLVFFVTTMTYFAILSLIATKGQVFMLETENNSILFLFWRLYFINHVINPLIYGFMDQRFKQSLKLGIYTNKSTIRWMTCKHDSRVLYN